MLELLKFVQRGVARRDYVPGLTHFRIVDGRVTGYNGAYSLSSPVDIGFNVAPNAMFFTKALNACEEVVQLYMEGEDLMVRSGSLKVAVPCVALESVPETRPEGVTVPPHGSILGALKALKGFIGLDASRPWATGILFAGSSAYATNNVAVAEYWLGTPFPHVVNVPRAVIDEVIRVDEELTNLQIAEDSITFHYANGRWIKSQLLALDWPNMTDVMDGAWSNANLSSVPSGLREACEKLSLFADVKDNRVHFRGGDISTKKEGAVRGGATIQLTGIPDFGCFNLGYLNDVLAIADRIDFTAYPNPVPFIGPLLRGALCGMTDQHES